MSRVNLYEELYVDLINDRGHKCIWQRAVVCHCVSRDTGQPDFMCETCHGSGYRYLEPKEITLAVTSFTSKYEMSNIMLRQPGTAYVTTKAEDIMGFKDRIIFSDFRCTFSEVIHWNESEDGRGISPKLYRDIKEVLFLADDEFEYEAGIDFEITEDGYHLRWLNDDYMSKLDGRNMSILYYTTPSYLVDDLLHELRATISDRKSGGQETFRELPKQYRIVREDFIYGVNKPQPEPEPDTESNVTWVDEGVFVE